MALNLHMRYWYTKVSLMNMILDCVAGKAEYLVEHYTPLTNSTIFRDLVLSHCHAFGAGAGGGGAA